MCGPLRPTPALVRPSESRSVYARLRREANGSGGKHSERKGAEGLPATESNRKKQYRFVMMIIASAVAVMAMMVMKLDLSAGSSVGVCGRRVLLSCVGNDDPGLECGAQTEAGKEERRGSGRLRKEGL